MSIALRPSLQDLDCAHEVFLEIEPRQVFYRVATELVRLARGGCTALDLVDALAVLLLTWNQAYYRYHPLTGEDIDEFEALLERSQETLAGLESRSIASLREEDRGTVQALFSAFREALGPVGAAKALHLLGPDFFPLWDNAIAKAYHTKLTAEGYWEFMQETQAQYTAIATGSDRPLLKQLDEYNFVKYTKKDPRL